MALSTLGREVSTTILGGAHQMWLHGEEITAVAVAFCAVIAPAAYIALMLAVMLAVRRPRAPWLAGELLRWAEWVRRWAMDEVMMLGILVALVKMADLATVIPGTAFSLLKSVKTVFSGAGSASTWNVGVALVTNYMPHRLVLA
jgi:paraquat-inducible protein A